MQAAVPGIVDLAGETPETLALYGVDSPVAETAGYARQCLLARRLCESGVPFVEVESLDWDGHSEWFKDLPKKAGALDRAIAGRTTFIVAHRLSTLRRADFIIVLERGRIVQQGTHAQLMRESGPYQHVASLQLVDGRALAAPGEGAA